MTVHARWPLAAIRGFHRFTASLGSANGWQRIRTVRPQKAVRVLGGMKAKEAREPDYSAIDLAIYAKVLLLVKSITCHNDLARISEVRAALLRFGIEPGAASYVLLLQLRHSQPCPLHLALLKRLANSCGVSAIQSPPLFTRHRCLASTTFPLGKRDDAASKEVAREAHAVSNRRRGAGPVGCFSRGPHRERRSQARLLTPRTRPTDPTAPQGQNATPIPVPHDTFCHTVALLNLSQDATSDRSRCGSPSPPPPATGSPPRAK